MKFFEFEERMKKNPFFTASEVKTIFPNQNNVLVQISFWKNRGYIDNLRRGIYVLKKMENDIDPMAFSNKLYAPSYLSLEFALNYYGIIPDIPGTYTSVTTKKTNNFKNKFGIYSYQKIRGNFFTGYQQIDLGVVSVLLATPEKAILDYIYLNKHKLQARKSFWRELRINEDFVFSQRKIEFYKKLLSNKKVNKLIDSLLEYQKNVG